MAKLMGDDAGGEAKRVADLVQIITELTNECLFAARAGQKPSIGRQWIKGTKELEARDEFTHKGIHRDHTFCFEFAERNVNRPLIRACRAKAVEGQIGTFTDAHTRVANQQKGVATQIIAQAEFLLQEFTLFCREWAWKSLREARNILAADQMSEFRKVVGPNQFVADAAQSAEQVDIGRGRERWCLRTEATRPCPTFGRPVHLGSYPIDYGPVLLRRPFGFHLTVDTLPSGVQQAVALGRSWLYPAFAFVPV
jgi:hypothetical protein